jgi:large subunit ribosomal protein L18
MFKKIVEKDRKRLKRKIHIRKNLHGTAARPRMSVFRSNKNMSVQLIDDDAACTLVSASSLEKDLNGMGKTMSGAESLGEVIGKRSLEKGVKEVVFDRNGYLYHGKVKALADGARKAGLQF